MSSAGYRKGGSYSVCRERGGGIKGAAEGVRVTDSNPSILKDTQWHPQIETSYSLVSCEDKKLEDVTFLSMKS